MINWLSDPLVQISSNHCQSQAGRARELKFWENVHPTLCVMCHVSHVACHNSLLRVTCHLSHDIFLFLFLIYKKIILRNIGQSGGAGWWRVCYQWGSTPSSLTDGYSLTALKKKINMLDWLTVSVLGGDEGRSNIPLRLKEYPRAKPKGTSEEKWVYLTVYIELSPTTACISFYISF